MATQPRIDHKSIAPPALPKMVPRANKTTDPAPSLSAESSASTLAELPTPVEPVPPPPAPPVSSGARAHGAAMWNGMHAAVFGTLAPSSVDSPSEVRVRVEPINEDDEPIFDGQTVFTAVPSWLASMTVHLLIVLLTALFALPSDPPPRPFELLLGEASAPLADMDSLAAIEFDSFDAEPVEDPSEFEEEVEPNELAAEEFNPMDDLADSFNKDTTVLQDALTTMTTLADLGEEIVSGGNPSGGATSAPMIAGGLGLRSTQTRLNQVIGAGGTKASEEAVARALRWLAKMQRDDGGWDLRDNAKRAGMMMPRPRSSGARNGATGLALLPFLGAGHTHKQGEYRYVVERGLEFLLGEMKIRGQGNTAKGSLTDQQGNYYSHGLCTIAMCEAYAMTRDNALRMPAQQLINEVVDAQDPRGGGWRYHRRSSGDTSVLGWQLMALKSGKMAYLAVPDKSFKGASRFLNSVQQNYGANYGYTSRGARPSMTAVGLLSRMYLGWGRDRPAMSKGVRLISQHGPNKDEIYFSYYATQVLHHYGGPMWENWNVVMRDSLVNSQTRGGADDGSWKLRASHEQSRIYCTSLATMILEVYYRHLPLYQQQAADGVPIE